jgi:hypothetical protein
MYSKKVMEQRLFESLGKEYGIKPHKELHVLKDYR